MHEHSTYRIGIVLANLLLKYRATPIKAPPVDAAPTSVKPFTPICSIWFASSGPSVCSYDAALLVSVYCGITDYELTRAKLHIMSQTHAYMYARTKRDTALTYQQQPN